MFGFVGCIFYILRAKYEGDLAFYFLQGVFILVCQFESASVKGCEVLSEHKKLPVFPGAVKASHCSCYFDELYAEGEFPT